MPRIRIISRPKSASHCTEHSPNPAPLQAAPRCGARTRAGASCRAPRVRGRSRCRMHGCARGAGAPTGNRNAYRHGFYSAAEQARCRGLRCLIGECEAVLRVLNGGESGKLLPQFPGAWGCSSNKEIFRATERPCKDGGRMESRARGNGGETGRGKDSKAGGACGRYGGRGTGGEAGGGASRPEPFILRQAQDEDGGGVGTFDMRRVAAPPPGEITRGRIAGVLPRSGRATTFPRT